ncbi:MAG: phosphoenolpyruvate synthase [Candidatus Altiarchaeales archaeon HGW-Altiarchaeales-1]|nr:MAG: phosphoenolpyruvate synthase [Candidatus Altiarchaeales archaeon HGW-Altiarchaeales-1]
MENKTVKLVNFFDEVGKEDVSLVGGKGANLGEMFGTKIPVPEGFVVNVNAYKNFLNANPAIKEEISKILAETDIYNAEMLENNTKKIRELMMSVKMPQEISDEIKKAYHKLCGQNDTFVAVRSSATAEDLAEASFAGQQDTYLNIIGEDNVVYNVQKCWASLFTGRATFYRTEQKFNHMQTYLAVVVQRMINSQVSGVMFTASPITGENVIIIEAAYGLGEFVVGGVVTPDTYLVDKKTMNITDKKISIQKIGLVKKDGVTKQVDINEIYQNAQKFSDDKIKKLADVGKLIEEHYKKPMDVEWCEEDGKIYVVQARPVTTIKDEEVEDEKVKEETDEGTKTKEETTEKKVILSGFGVSVGIASGIVKIVRDASELSRIKQGDVLVTRMTTPDMVPAMKKAVAIITDEGGMTCHAAIVARELGIPCIVGTKTATKEISDGSTVTVDGRKGLVYEGRVKIEGAKKKVKKETAGQHVEHVVVMSPIITSTEIKGNVDFSEIAEKAVEYGADGVGLLRSEHMFLEIGEHPIKLIKENRREELVTKIMKGIRDVAEVMYPRPVWYRTLDLKTDEFKGLKGGENEPVEANPMIGWRGIRRSLDESEVLECEFEAIRRLQEDERLTNIGVMLPMIQHPAELRKAKILASDVGLDTDKMDFGIMVEIPAAALIIDDFIKEGISFISFGTNDLTQFTLALDRNSAHVAKLYNEHHPAVLKLIDMVIKACKKNNVKTSICGQAGSDPKMVEKLIIMGIDSVSANIDAIETIRKVAARVENKLLLESARKNFKD